MLVITSITGLQKRPSLKGPQYTPFKLIQLLPPSPPPRRTVGRRDSSRPPNAVVYVRRRTHRGPLPSGQQGGGVSECSFTVSLGLHVAFRIYHWMLVIRGSSFPSSRWGVRPWLLALWGKVASLWHVDPASFCLHCPKRPKTSQQRQTRIGAQITLRTPVSGPDIKPGESPALTHTPT